MREGKRFESVPASNVVDEGNRMERKRSVRRRQKPPFERAKDHCRAFTAFMFSNVGITFLVVLYTIAGEFILRYIRSAQQAHITLNLCRKSEVK